MNSSGGFPGEDVFARIPSLAMMAPSIRDMRRRTETDDRLSISGLYRKASALAFFLEHGDRKTRAAAEVLGYRMIFEAMVARLHGSNGAIPRFADHIRRSERTFEEILS